MGVSLIRVRVVDLVSLTLDTVVAKALRNVGTAMKPTILFSKFLQIVMEIDIITLITRDLTPPSKQMIAFSSR